MNVIIDEEVDGDDLIPLELLEFGIPRRIYERQEHFETMDAVTFRKRFRLPKCTVQSLLEEIREKLEVPQNVNNMVSPMNQLLLTLRLYSTGGHLDAVGDFAGVHVSTVSRIVARVTDALASLYSRYIVMPTTQEKRRQTQQDFYNLASFPRVIGAIDCTHCRIISPGGPDAEIYRNRKGYFSINTQMVCDAKLRICNVVARWPGSTHDSTIFNNSRLKRDFENHKFPNCILLGDNGYANNNYLLTPLLATRTAEERRYNSSQIKTRNPIERLFGVLKRRFPILLYGCRLKVQTFLNIIVAAAVLHNRALADGDEIALPLPDELDGHRFNQLLAQDEGANRIVDERALPPSTTRTIIINECFTHIL